MNAALAGDGASFEMLSANDTDGIDYSSIAGGKLMASEQARVANSGYFPDGTIALLQIHGELFVAATQGRPDRDLIVTPAHQP